MDNRSPHTADPDTHRLMDTQEKNAQLRRDARNWWIVIVLFVLGSGVLFGEVLHAMVERGWR